MGTIVMGECPCGYETKLLFEEVGFRMQPPRELCQCGQCLHLFTLPEHHPIRKCPACQYGNIQRIYSPGEGLSCPKCRRHTLHLFAAGIWD